MSAGNQEPLRELASSCSPWYSGLLQSLLVPPPTGTLDALGRAHDDDASSWGCTKETTDFALLVANLKAEDYSNHEETDKKLNGRELKKEIIYIYKACDDRRFISAENRVSQIHTHKN